MVSDGGVVLVGCSLCYMCYSVMYACVLCGVQICLPVEKRSNFINTSQISQVHVILSSRVRKIFVKIEKLFLGYYTKYRVLPGSDKIIFLNIFLW